MAIGAGAALGLGPRLALAEGTAPLLKRPIPASGEAIPVVGLGSSATFRSAAEGPEADALGEVLARLVARGASVFDTAPSYGASEEVAGRNRCPLLGIGLSGGADCWRSFLSPSPKHPYRLALKS